MLLGDPEGGLGGAPAEAAEVGGQTVGACSGRLCTLGSCAASLPRPLNEMQDRGIRPLVVSGGKGLKGHSQCFGTDYESSRDASH